MPGSVVIEVAGRQGVATDGESYFVSGNTALYRYSKSGDLLASNEDALDGLPLSANHIRYRLPRRKALCGH